MFKNSLIRISYASLLLGLFTATGWSSDTLIQVTSQAGQASNDSIVWSQLGIDQTVLAASFNVTSANGATVGVALAGPSSIASVVCSAPAATVTKNTATGSLCSWTSGTGGTSPFTGGDTLLSASNAANGGNGPVTLTFAKPVAGAGALIQANVPGQFTAQITAFNGNTNLGSFAQASDTFGNPVYIGLKDQTGANVTSIQFSLTACGATALGSDDCNDFALDTAYLNTVAAGPPTTVSVSPNNGSGSAQAFTAIYSDANGASDLSEVRMLINSTLTASNGCYVRYVAGTGQLQLLNNAGSSWSGGLNPGGTGSVANSQCTLFANGSSVTPSGNTLTVVFNISFTGFSGTKRIWLYAVNKENQNSGLNLRGTFTASGSMPKPVTVSVNPSNGSGSSHAFTTVYSDANGAADLSEVRMLINSTLTASNGCYVRYVAGTGQLQLLNNGGSAWSAGLTPNGTGSVANSQCTLFANGSSVSPSGNTLTVVFNISFSASFDGSKKIWLYAINKEAQNSGLNLLGTFTVTGGATIAR